MSYKAYKINRKIPWGQGLYEVNKSHAFMIDRITLSKSGATYDNIERDFAFAYFLASELKSNTTRKKVFFEDPETCNIINHSVTIYFGVSNKDFDESSYTQKEDDVASYDLYKKDLSITDDEFFNFINEKYKADDPLVISGKAQIGEDVVKIIHNPVALWLPDLISNWLTVHIAENNHPEYGLISSSLNTSFNSDIASGVSSGSKTILAGALDMNLLGNISEAFIYCWIAGRAFEQSFKPANETITILR